MDFDTAVLHLSGGLARAGLIFIVAAGLTLQFGALRIVNLGHGSLYMIAAYLTTTTVVRYGDAGFWLALVVIPVAIALLGLVIERTIFRRLYDGSHLPQILVSFAIVFIVGDVMRTVYGNQPKSLRRPGILAGNVEIFGTKVATYNIFIVVVATLIAVVLFWLLRRSTFGLQIRAAVSDRDVLGSLGVNVSALFAGVFGLGSWLAGVAGVVVAGSAAARPGMDVDIILVAFAVIFIGGFGSVLGSLLAAVVVGLVEAFGVVYFPRGGQVLVFITMALVLAFRPTGILGREPV